MILSVISPGLTSAWVGSPRTGGRSFGLPMSGPADVSAAMLARGLVGAYPNAAVLEFTLLGPTLEINETAKAIVFGAAVEAMLGGRAIDPSHVFEWPAGTRLTLGAVREGCRAYLAMCGDLEQHPETPPPSPLPEAERGNQSRPVVVRASGLHLLRMQAGGPHHNNAVPVPPLRFGEGVRGWGGSALRPGESRPLAERAEYHFGLVSSDARIGRYLASPISSVVLEDAEPASVLHLLPGPQADQFDPDVLTGREWLVDPRSDRMGVRLTGEAIAFGGGEMVSQPVFPGAVQVTNSGLPIMLGVDGQTVGGYPVPAYVIAADRDKMAQLRPGSAVRFVAVTADEAALRLEKRGAILRRMLAGLRA